MHERSSRIAIDDRDWPILRVRWSEVSMSIAALDAFAADAERYYARGARFGVVVDAHGAAPLGPMGIARALGIERRHARLAKDVLVGRAIVLPHEVAVRALTTVLGALPIRLPTRAFVDDAAAESWLRDALSAHSAL